MSEFNVDGARAWLRRTGNDHIESDLVEEGNDLIALSHRPQLDEQVVRQGLARICCWDDDGIDEAVSEIEMGEGT